MTREAKIGMLTGLGVIVLIGVLLSNYLGDPKTGGPIAAVASSYGPTGRMADLGVGDTYRQQLMQPVGVTPIAGPGAPTQQLPGGSEIATPIDGSDRAMPPAAFAVEKVQPRTTPVAPIPAGAVQGPASASLDGPPVISLAEPAPVPVKVVDVSRPAGVQNRTQVIYEVASGDSLGKIAKKFYNSSKSTDVQRIVAANPSILKNATTMLVVSTKLVIPGVAPAADKATQPVNVYMPGDLAKSAPTPDATRKVQPPVPLIAAKTTLYAVQSGDTLEKIARKLAPTKVSDMIQKITSLNGIKDPASLKAGTKIKVPA